MSAIRLALIGCGKIGKIHAECIQKIPEASFSAFADANAKAADELSAAFGGDYATTDVARILSDKSIQAVYICTQHDTHASLSIAAARAGKHIFIEKPLALTIEDCERVSNEVARAKVFMMPGFKMRYYPLVQRAHEFIPQPIVIVGQMMDSRWGDSAWAQIPLKGGANVHSQGCHTTDLMRYFAGCEPKRLWAAGGAFTHPGHPCIDQCVAAIQFENGSVASWIQGDASLPPYVSKFYFELFGADGRSVQIYDRLKKATFHDGKNTWTEERAEEEGFFLEDVEFITALKLGRRPALTALDGLQATRMVLSADRAIRTGQVQLIQ